MQIAIKNCWENALKIFGILNKNLRALLQIEACTPYGAVRRQRQFVPLSYVIFMNLSIINELLWTVLNENEQYMNFYPQPLSIHLFLLYTRIDSGNFLSSNHNHFLRQILHRV